MLIPLSAVYRLPLDDFVGAPPVGDPRIHPRPFCRRGGVYVPLTRDMGDVLAFKLVLPGRGGLQEVEQRSHLGYERLFVLRGRALLKLGDEVAALGAGEAVEFDTRMSHGLVSGTGEVVEVLGLFSRDGGSLRTGCPERASRPWWRRRTRPRPPGPAVESGCAAQGQDVVGDGGLLSFGSGGGAFGGVAALGRPGIVQFE